MYSRTIEISPPIIFSNNLRVVLLMFGFALFSFGILGQLVFLANVGFIGGVFSVLNYFGFPVMSIFIAGVLPHAVLEIPAVILASAAVLQFGAILVTPDPARTMGEVLIYTLADWFKIFVGLVLPLLFVAALIEAYITPKFLVNVM